MSVGSPPLDAVVVGAGISGLTTAFRLRRAGLRVAVLEAEPRAGGALETWTEGAWRFEMGPNTVLESHPEVSRLLQEAGLEADKVTARASAKRRYLWKGGALHALPGGPPGLLETPLFSTRAKLRLLREPWIGRPPADREESIAGFVERRLGPEILRYAVSPFVSGIYAGDPERLSVRWALPRLWALEAEHGSLIRGALALKKGSKAGPAGPMFSFRAGLEELPRRLAREIGDVRTGIRAQRLVRLEDGYRVDTSAGPVEAAQVVLAVPADAAARLLADASGGRSELLAEIPYAPVTLVSLGYQRSAVSHPLGGFGFLAPRDEGLRILGCLFPSEIFPDRAPDGHVALAVFLGGRTDPEIAGAPDERLLEVVQDDLRRALGVSGPPVLARVRRWPRAIPQYEIGHGRFVERGAEIERELPGVHLGGNFLRGISVPDCIRNATALAEEVLRRHGAGQDSTGKRPGAGETLRAGLA